MIRVDEQNSWPDSIREILIARCGDCCPEDDVRREVINAIDAQLSSLYVAAYHCTRLTADELDDVARNGLRALDLDHRQTRVQTLERAGLLDAWTARECLTQLDQCGRDKYRFGKVWAVLCRSALEDEFGLGEPLAFWGGEAIRTQDTKAALGVIGVPTIIVFKVQVSRLSLYSVGAAILDQFLFDMGLQDEDGANDACVDGSIPPTDIIEVISRSTPAFVTLTKCDDWSRYSL